MTVITVDGQRLTPLEWMRHPLYDTYQNSNLIDNPDRFIQIVERVQQSTDTTPDEIVEFIDAFDEPGHAEWIATGSTDEIATWVIDGLVG